MFFLEFINKNHTNITKLTTTADDETIVVVDGSDKSAVGSASLATHAQTVLRPEAWRNKYAPSALKVRHLLYRFKVFRSASQLLPPQCAGSKLNV